MLLDEDPLLRRLERRALAFCLGAALAALIVRGGNPDVALGVLAGGLLMAVSYGAIRSSVTGLVALVAKAAAARPSASIPAARDEPALPGDSAPARHASRVPDTASAPDAMPPASARFPGAAPSAGHAFPLGAVVADPSGSRPKKGAILLRLAGRYALLGLVAYGMIARLRLHPVGLVIGVSSLFAAASLEVLAGRRERRS